MNIDFHYGVTYVVARLAGMNPADAQTIAHASQYVDNATTSGILKFSGGETYERFASAHEMLDYKNMLDEKDRLVWAPFHFLPAGEGKDLDEKSVCRPDSKIAREMMRRAIGSKPADNGLHRLGVSLHVYVDSWAHQGFSGTISEHNVVLSLEGHDHDHKTWFAKLKDRFVTAGENIEADALSFISKLGHGAALHFPDMPWAKWTYTNSKNVVIERDNLPDFIQAANMACKVVQGYLKGNPNYELEAGLPADSLKALENLLAKNCDHDEQIRLTQFSMAIANGKVPGIMEAIPPYIAKGEGSWKHAATGITANDDGAAQPQWSAKFEDSHYRKFHDAVKQHRFAVTQEILPAHQVRIA
jgi:hypothetical protein